MFDKFVLPIRSFFLNDFRRIPEDCLDEYTEEIVMLNWKRANKLQTLLFLCNFLLLIVDRYYYHTKWASFPAYKNLYYAHVVSLCVIAIYALLCFAAVRYIKSIRFFKVLYMGIAIYSLAWCEFLSANAQLIHGQISAYIVSAFCIASFIYLNPLQGIMMFLFSYISFVAGLIHVRHDAANLSANIINSGLLIALSILISKLQYSNFVTNFLNNKLIKRNAVVLNKLNNNLEKLVEERTAELVEANEAIVEELKVKHQMELEIASARAVYAEKEKELAEFKELEKLRTAFFSNVSHELKTPINIILSSQQLLNYKLKGMLAPKDFGQISKQTFHIKQNSYRLIRLVSNLLDITKIDSGYFDLNLRNYDIVGVVEDIVLSVAEYIESKNLELVFDTEIEEKIVACDADKMERVILNLLSNAVKYTEEHGSIFVNLYLGEGSIKISVRDTGIGIPENLQASVFDRFFQVDSSLARKSEGTGIGLSLVKSIVELHQGKITLKSEMGVGSEFIIELPDRALADENPEYKSNDTGKNSVQMINIEFSDIYTL